MEMVVGMEVVTGVEVVGEDNVWAVERGTRRNSYTLYLER